MHHRHLEAFGIEHLIFKYVVYLRLHVHYLTASLSIDVQVGDHVCVNENVVNSYGRADVEGGDTHQTLVWFEEQQEIVV